MDPKCSTRNWEAAFTDFAKIVNPIKVFNEVILDVPASLERDTAPDLDTYSDVCGGFGHASVTSPIGSDTLDDISSFSVEGGVGKLRIYPTKVAQVGTFSVSAK